MLKIWVLIRVIAVISSSMATILSSLLPIYLRTSISSISLGFLFIFLSIAAVTIHGILTHALNDYTDYRTGTDAHSPAILSGGSRVIQTRLFTAKQLRMLGKWLTISLLLLVFILLITAKFKLACLLFIGVWATVSYSVPPFLFSYRPFAGDWLSLFPSLFALGIAGPWLVLDSIPIWAIQNALINAFICMGWVMVHHIPDLQADQFATPKKRTTVVFFVERFGKKTARLPATVYYILATLCCFWVWMDRPFAAIGTFLLCAISILLVLKLKFEDVLQISQIEKMLLLLAMMTAVILGIG